MQVIDDAIKELTLLFEQKRSALQAANTSAHDWGKLKNAEMHINNFKVMFGEAKKNTSNKNEIVSNFKKAAQEIQTELKAIQINNDGE